MKADDIAREAARLIETGRAGDVDEAIRLVVDRLELSQRRGVRLPSHGLVREHVRGFAMQSLGAEGYAASVRDVWSIAEEVMTLFEAFEPTLAGRAVKGQVDAGATLNIRIYTAEGMDALARQLVEAGYEEPSIDTINTRFGRLNRLRFDEGGHEVILTRCGPEMRGDAGRNLFQDVAIGMIDLAHLRRRIAE